MINIKTFLKNEMNKYRSKTGLRYCQNQFAELIGIDPGTFSKWINGSRTPNLKSFQLILDALGMEIKIVKKNAKK